MQKDKASIGLQRQLPSALQLHILSLLPPNDRALSGRLVSPDAAAGLSGPEHCTASLSQPLPPHAAPWAVEAGQQHVRQLPFRHKLHLLCTAAASGSEVNLEVALALLLPSIFPELLHSYNDRWAKTYVPPSANPGVAAVRASHPQLLGWLLSHCPGLVEREQVLTAAAKHCDLAGLQAAFGALSVDPAQEDRILNAAAESPTPDAVAKMEWLMRAGGRRLNPQGSTAEAAACSGDLGRLQWLRARGCPMEGLGVLREALQHADLAVAQWLVDEAGCELPEDGGTDDDTDDEDEWGWGSLLEAAAGSSDGLAKLGWLLQRRVGQLQASHWQRMAEAAAEAGRLEMVQHALSVLGSAADMPNGLADMPGDLADMPGDLADMPGDLALAAAGSGSVPLVQFLRHVGVEFDDRAYLKAAWAGCLAMVRWLACEAGVPAEGLPLSMVVEPWPNGPTAATSRELLQAVQLLVGEVGAQACNHAARLVAAAARRGELALMQYLLQQRPRYRPDWAVVLAAAEGGCEALLEWLVGGCLKVHRGSSSPYVSAAVAGDLATLTALRRLGVPWGAQDIAAMVWPYPGLTPAARHWLVEQGAPGDWQKVRDRARGNGVLVRCVAFCRRLQYRQRGHEKTLAAGAGGIGNGSSLNAWGGGEPWCLMPRCQDGLTALSGALPQTGYHTLVHSRWHAWYRWHRCTFDWVVRRRANRHPRPKGSFRALGLHFEAHSRACVRNCVIHKVVPNTLVLDLHCSVSIGGGGAVMDNYGTGSGWRR